MLHRHYYLVVWIGLVNYRTVELVHCQPRVAPPDDPAQTAPLCYHSQQHLLSRVQTVERD